MGCPNNRAPKLFGLFAIAVICCMLVGNVYQISAESKVDTDLVFDSQEHSKHGRINRAAEQLENESSLVEENWLTSTVNRLKRSIDSLFSNGATGEKSTMHQQVGKKHHRKASSKNKSSSRRKHRQADDTNALDDDDYDDQFQIDQDQEQQQGQQELSDYENWENGTGQNIDDDNDEFSILQIGEGEGQGQEQTNEDYDINDNEDNNGGAGNNEFNHPDDEDIHGSSGDNGDYGSGDGEETSPRTDYPHPRVYRIAFTVMEPYREDYKDRNSPSFQQLSDRIKRALDHVFEQIPGHQNVQIISMEQSKKQDPFKVRVTADIDSEGNSNSEDIKRAIFEPINTNHRLGDLTTTDPDELRFTEFGAADQKCPTNELQCRSGQCVSATSRCDGIRDCNDNSDEEGCSYNVPVEPDIPAVDTTTTTTTTTERVPITAAPIPVTTTPGQPETTTRRQEMTETPPTTPSFVPDEGSGAGDCRADDSVRCADGSRAICADQVCDGLPDCDDGGDELNCRDECRLGEFKCDVYRCIPKTQLCDGVSQCDDRTDELNCKKECNNDEFACDDQCLPNSKKCDGLRDCMDNVDELNCPEQQRCPAGEFSCGPGEACIPDYLRCNGNRECRNGADEENCRSAGCRTDEFRCGNGLCIPKEKVCDRIYQCEDLSDERNCPCLPDDFRCQNGYCIPKSQRCDGVHHCQDGTDEVGCNQTTCQAHEWRCDDGTCIDQIYRCNLKQECPDRSDEIGCNECALDQFRCSDGTCLNINKVCDHVSDCPHSEDEESCVSCKPGEYQCANGECIEERFRCNNVVDCSDLSDERNCNSGPRCRSDEFECSEGYCIESYKQCNGYQDCPDGSDEDNCINPNPTYSPNPELACTANEFRCDDGMCIDVSYRCDGINDCIDKSDESRCDLEAVCRPDEVQCNDGRCVMGKKCDRVFDCYDRSDELHCEGTCDISEFKCNDGACIDEKLRCDGLTDCPDGSDEKNCETSCPNGEFRCENGVCLDSRRRCDGYPDCPNATDEQGCTNSPNVTTCTSEQFDCGDRCINIEYRCDTVADCDNGRDEENCGNCQENEFQCGSDQTCISIDKKCDGNSDCSDNSDEFDCPRQRCSSNQFTCDDGTCIDEYRQCDGRPDCPDSSDETDCRSCTEPEWFQCRDGACITVAMRCDNFYDCKDFSDEQNCVATCASGFYQCLDNFNCIPLSMRCNGRNDCNDGSDEYNCPTEPPTTVSPETTQRSISCPDGYKPCRSRDQCVRLDQICDGRGDCYDLSDETNCYTTKDGLDLKTYPVATEERERQEVVLTCRDEGPIRARVHWERANGAELPFNSTDIRGRLTMPNVQLHHSGTYYCVATDFPPNTPRARVAVPVTIIRRPPRPTHLPPTVCGVYEATCSNGECIPRSKVRDGKFDCSDGSDEDGYRPEGCEPNEFQCGNKKCVLKTWRCDSDDDCGDGSDEDNCGTSAPFSVCQYHQFACHSNNQCIPKSYHCDMQSDCVDGSDEVGCSKPVISRPPPPMVSLQVGETFEISCTAVGIPTPEIVWRLNWGHVPSKCRQASVNGVGTLICENVQVEDQGAYSCESLNIKGSTFAVPDTILNVKHESPCRPGYFNVQARSEGECIKCFCFGHASSCRSADLFIFQFQPPFDAHKVLGVRLDPSGAVDIRDEPVYSGADLVLSPNGPQGVYATVPSNGYLSQPNVIPYFAMPENYHGNQLKSYGGSLNYWIKHTNRGAPIQGPNVIISGNGYTLLHQSTHSPAPNTNENVRVRFFEGDWLIVSPGSRERPATREEIMMVLEDVDNILLKLLYNEGQLNVTISNVEVDSAGLSNVGLGPANYVEECSCPVGYSGTSCERCSEGYVRQNNGPWLGLCVKEPTTCPRGMYNDGRECQPCPCPLTDASNQFGTSCHLGSNGDVVCQCPVGYVGNRCQYCAEGYEGSPLTPGDYCRPVRPPPPPLCDPAGSVDPRPDEYGRCRCKNSVDGPTCNQCKANTFHLSSSNQFGCVSCFCMGVSSQCSSSHWYRTQISTVFVSSIQDFRIVTNQNREAPITAGIVLDQSSRQISYSSFTVPDIYYWDLPSRYLGNKLTSYGGYLRYSIRHSPIPGGQSSRNNAADVELVSKNNINLLYYNKNQTHSTSGAQIFLVPILEQYWQRTDGQIADREHLLMVLADLEKIYIKATYFTNTQQSSLISVSLDIANEHNTGSLQRALEVEQCHCPEGYTGLSCENCDVGYTRTANGLYLGLCEACSCNGYSNDCDPDTGTCLNCKNGTTGDYCDECLEGYTGDPANGIPCTYRGTPPPCNCDPRGSVSNQCRDGRCDCKANVEGNNCDRCRPGSFGLNSSSIDGCEFCFCSGVVSNCRESNLYIEQIPYQISETDHGFTITDTSRNVRITDFTVNEFMNEISYGILPSNRDSLYWSLPSIFTGNKIRSYGGKLEFSQRYTQRPQARYVPDKDIIIIGNGITIFWTNPYEQREGIVNPISVALHPTAEWFRWNGNQGPKPASREDILTVLAKIEVILIRATQSSDTIRAYLSDITLDTAVEQFTGKPKAASVEVCRCPLGYEGTSCESCDAGYYKDLYFDLSRPLGSCTKCPCNDREESCELGPDQRVICHCRPEWTGRNCEYEAGYPTTTEYPDTTTVTNEPTIEVTIEDTNIGIYEVGGTVRYNCSARSRIAPVPMRIFWRKADGDLPRHAIDDGRGLLVITNLRVSDSGRYVCEASDGYTIVTSSVNLNVGVPHDQPPRIALSQNYVEVNEGQPIEVQCVGTGVPTPDLHLVRDDGSALSRGQIFENGLFRIQRAQLSDSGEYTCAASNRVGSVNARFTIVVRELTVGTIVRVDITPPSFSGVSGDTVTLRCSSTPYGQTIRWTKEGGDLPYSSREDRGTLVIRDATPDVSGVYVCTITSASGLRGSKRVTVDIRESSQNEFPTARVSTERVTLNQGGSIEIQCSTSGTPPPTVKWTKLGEDLSKNTEQFGSTLNIHDALVRDRGVYVCVATNVHGIAQASVVVEVTRLETPRLEIHPQTTQTVIAGNSAVIQCRAIAGIPSPTLTWSRENNLPLGSNVEEMSGGTLRFTSITTAEEGEYICTAVNEAGRATATAHIVVHTPPEVVVTPRQEVVTKNLGDSFRLECQATGIPQPTVVWSKYGEEIRKVQSSRPLYYGLPNIAYQEFTRLTKDDEGLYICRAESAAGITERRVQLYVDTLPSRGDITEWPPRGEDATSTGERPNWKDNEPSRPHYTTTFRPEPPVHEQEYIAPIGGRAEIRCSIANENGVNIQVRWSRTDGSPLPPNAYERSGVLYIDNVEPEAQGEYSCTGYDQYGIPVFKLDSYLTVISPPRITLIPPRQIVHPGENAYINCSASGQQPIEISWSPIDREMPESVYTREGYIRFNNIQLQDAGRYLCRANNRAGSAEAVADVIVEENVSRPAIKAEQKQQIAPVGSTVTLRCRATNPSAANAIRWFRQDLELPVDSRQNGEVLYLRNVRQEDQGRYYCEIQTRDGSYSDYVDLQLTARQESCIPGWWACKNGNCIPDYLLCDGLNDCQDNSDETDCASRIRRGPAPTTPRSYLPPPSIYISPPESDHYVGENIEIYCQSSERGAIPVWSKVSGPLSSNVENVGGTLRIVNSIMDNAGIYRCEATGRQGVHYKDYNLNVIEQQYKDEPPLQIKETERGSTVVLECKVDFDATQYSWSKQGGELPKYVDDTAKTIQLNDVDGSDAGAYTCTASNNARTINLPVILVVTGIVPYFTQASNSYIMIPTLADSYIQFSFEISFKPQQDTGLILYNGNKGNDISGDFISLSLINGVPEFKYNLGMGTTSVKSNRPITINDWHTIKISRNRRKVTMYVDGDGPFVGLSEGKYTGLDLTEPLYIGGVPSPNGISPEVNHYNAYRGFVGCISRFKIGHAYLDILKEAINKTGITTCESCSDNKCQNQGACQEALSKEGYMCICPSGFSGPTCNKLKGEACSPHACGVGRCIDTENGFECQCPFGYAGRRCENGIHIVEPAFRNDAYLAYPTPKQPVRKLKVTLKVKPSTVEDGLLLYSSESEEGFGNFISLAIRDGHLEFRYDAGDGVSVIRDENSLRPGEWHVVTATRSLSEGRLLVDGQNPAVARKRGNYKTINLQTPLYIGGYDKQHIRVNDGVQVFNGFKGCISDINLAGADLNILQNITDSANVRDCSDRSEGDNSVFGDTTEKSFRHVSCSNNPCQNDGHCYPLSPTEYQCACAPGYAGKNCELSENFCNPNPCQNRGVCTLNNSHYVCDCPLGFTGRACDHVTELRNDANFEGNGYLEFSKELLSHQRGEQDLIALEISTNQSNGLVFWHGQTPEKNSRGQDYIALAIEDGYLVFSFDLGEGPAVIRNSNVMVNDGERHSVILKRNGKLGSMDIDNAWTVEGEATGPSHTLDTEGNVYLGGAPNVSRMTDGRYTQGFIGCIHGFELQNSQRLELGFKAVNGLNVKPCSSFLDRGIWSNDLVH